MKNFVYKEIGQRIKLLRVKNDMTQTDLANVVGYKTVASICNIEKGNIELNYSKLKKFADYFGVSVDWLMTGQSSNDGVFSELKECFYLMSADNQTLLLNIAKLLLKK